MNNNIFKSLLLVFCAIIIGCGGAYRATKINHPILEEREYIIYKNVSLKASIAVIEHESIEIGNLIKVRAKFKNMLAKQVNAEVKIKFLDLSGYEINDNWGWQPLIMESGEIKILERIATSPKACDYRILIQLAG